MNCIIWVENMAKIRCAVVGVGNCFAGLVQGIEYYRLHPEQQVVGVMHESMGGYSIHDLDFVAAFDVDSKKVGEHLNKAVYSEPNKVKWLPSLSKMGFDLVGPTIPAGRISASDQLTPSSQERLKREIVCRGSNPIL